MKPAVLDIKQTGDLGGTKVKMTFDQNSLSHIMSILTDLYSDPELAIIREYSTNAWDSHVEAGVTRPIEVQTPTSLSPYFKVKDFGIGLGEDEIIEIYSKYGASTKRNSDDFNGTLGLGCKSALTYTGQFTLAGIKNGVKTLVAISRSEDGSGVMEIISVSDTDEPNGVEVVIPVNRGNSLTQKAENFFRYWKPGTILLNGAEPTKLVGDEISPGIWLIQDTDGGYNRNGNDRLVMGNVSYPVADGLYSHPGYATFSVVAFVDIGDLHFTPSREDLQYTKHTKDTIEIIKLSVKENIMKFANSSIEACVSRQEAMDKAHHWYSVLGRNVANGSFAYKGKPVPQSFEHPGGAYTGWNTYSPLAIYRHKSGNNRSIMVKDLQKGKIKIVIGLPEEKQTSYRKSRLKQWAENNRASEGFSGNTLFIFADSNPDPDWIDSKFLIDWTKIESETTSPSAASGSRGPQNYKILSNGWWQDTVNLPQGTKFIYISPSEIDDDRLRQYEAVAKESGTTLVKIGANRFDKFNRENPGSKHIHVVARELRQKAIDGLTNLDRQLLGMGYAMRQTITGLPANDLLDPRIKHLAKVANSKDSPTLSKYNSIVNITYGHGSTVEAEPMDIPDVDVLDEYPLVRLCYNGARNTQLSAAQEEHLIKYMNAYYLEMKEKENAV